MANENQDIEKIVGECEASLSRFGHKDLRRLFHGRGGVYGKELSFLSVDNYSPCLLITLYEDRDDNWCSELALRLMVLPSVRGVALQNRVRAPWEGKILQGVVPKSLVVKEEGLSYEVSLGGSHNSGIFGDMREGRTLVRSISKGKRVLNLFSYTCPFSVAAVAGGCDYVLNMDMNSNSLNQGRSNHRINENPEKSVRASVEYLKHNILKSLGKIEKKGPFDLLIIDPPPSQGESFKLERDYGKILRRAPSFLSDGGEILACLNSHNYDTTWFTIFLNENLPTFEIVEKLFSGEDYPELDGESGLKIFYLRMNNVE